MATLSSFRRRRSRSGGSSLSDNSPRRAQESSPLVGDLFADAAAWKARKRVSERPSSPFVLEPTAHRVEQRALRQLQSRQSVSIEDLSKCEESQRPSALTEQTFDVGMCKDCVVSASANNADACKIVDGREFTSWRSCEGTGVWVLFDFQTIEQRHIDSIVIRWWSDCRPDTIVVEVSGDNTSLFDKVQIIRDIQVDTHIQPTLSIIKNLVFKQRFRYLRLRMFVTGQLDRVDRHFHRYKIGIVNVGIFGQPFSPHSPLDRCPSILDSPSLSSTQQTLVYPEIDRTVKVANSLHKSLFPPSAVFMQAPLDMGAWGKELLLPKEAQVSVVHFAAPDTVARTTNLHASLVALSYVYPMKGQIARLNARSYPRRFAPKGYTAGRKEPEHTEFQRPAFSRPISAFGGNKSSTRPTTGATRPQTAGQMRPGSGGNHVLAWKQLKRTGEYVNTETGEVVAETPETLFTAPHDTPLPPGWHRAVDAGLGLAYYWREGEEDKTSWEFPVGEIDANQLH